MAADAYRVTNASSTIAAATSLTKGELQAASFFSVDIGPAGGDFAITLFSDAAADAGDIGRVLWFAVTANSGAANGNTVTMAGGAGITVNTFDGTGGGDVDTVGDFFWCLIMATNLVTCERIDF